MWALHLQNEGLQACDDVMDRLRQTTSMWWKPAWWRKSQNCTSSGTGTNQEQPVEVVQAPYKDALWSAPARALSGTSHCMETSEVIQFNSNQFYLNGTFNNGHCRKTALTKSGYGFRLISNEQARSEGGKETLTEMTWGRNLVRN